MVSIGEYSFFDCEGLEAVNISELSAWCKIDFYNNGYYYSQGNNPLAYARNLYLNGVLLEDLVIPNDVTEIKPWAFCGAECINSVVIPNSVNAIGMCAFSDCSNMTSVDIPNTITLLDIGVFDGCNNLSVVNIPESITKIEKRAFGNNDFEIINVFCEVPPVISYQFSDYTFKNCVLNIPIGTLESYMSADGWKNFRHIQETICSGVDVVENDDLNVTSKDGKIEINRIGGVVEVYNLAGQRVYSGTGTTICGLEKGMYVVRVAGQTFKVAL